MSAAAGELASLDCAVVIFDLDGVVIDSHDAMRRSFVEAYESLSGDSDPALFDEYATYQGLHFPDIVEIMGLPAGMYDAFVAASTRNLDRVQICAGIHELLAQLDAAGIQRAIATGKSRGRAVEVLTHLGIEQAFDLICGSDEVASGKPAPDILQLVLDRLGVLAVDAIYVGDAIADRQSAIAAGIRFAAATWVSGDHLLVGDFDDQGAVFDSPQDLAIAVLGER